MGNTARFGGNWGDIVGNSGKSWNALLHSSQELQRARYRVSGALWRLVRCSVGGAVWESQLLVSLSEAVSRNRERKGETCLLENIHTLSTTKDGWSCRLPSVNSSRTA